MEESRERGSGREGVEKRGMEERCPCRVQSIPSAEITGVLSVLLSVVVTNIRTYVGISPDIVWSIYIPRL